MDNLVEKLKFSFIYELINPIVQRYELCKWALRRKTSTTPHLIKQRLVRKYATYFDLKTFIETGTYLGVMVNAVKDIFDTVYTIELDKKLYKRAKQKCSKDSNIKVILGDSSKILPKVLQKLKSPALFWLDAHYSGGITAKGKKETPVLDELKLIMNHNYNHVILIDDANMFIGKAGYPSLKKVNKSINNKKKGYALKIESNILIINN